MESRPLTGARGRAYRLTKTGEEFREVVDRLGEWGQRWATWQFAPDNLEVSLLMWATRHRVARDQLPGHRVVVRFEYHGVPARWRNQRTWWLILDRSGVDLCLTHPGLDVDLVVLADVATMGRVWTGHLTFAQAMRSGGVRIEGARALAQAFPRWLQLSPFAAVQRAVPAG